MLEHSRAQVVGYAVAALLAVAAAVKLLSPDRRASERAPAVRVDRGDAAPGRAAGAYVHVAGAVRKPGLYRVPTAARVAAALARAGGPLRKADLAAVNLAAQVQDGQQIVVPRAGARAPPGGEATGTGGGHAKVSLASATAEQLDQLDGIGPKLAKRILDYRDAHGGFRSVDQLREVEGIGEKRLAALRDAVTP